MNLKRPFSHDYHLYNLLLQLLFVISLKNQIYHIELTKFFEITLFFLLDFSPNLISEGLFFLLLIIILKHKVDFILINFLNQKF